MDKAERCRDEQEQTSKASVAQVNGLPGGQFRVGALGRSFCTLSAVAAQAPGPRPGRQAGDDTRSPAWIRSNGFMPVPGCLICAVVQTVVEAAWHREDGLTLHTWLPVTASGMRHRMTDHGLPPGGRAAHE
jgi:hypothetical protein